MKWGVLMFSLVQIWGFPKIGVPQNGWFIKEHPIKMDDLGVPLFLETPISTQAPFVSFPVAPQALITGNFQHFFIHVWSSLAPAKAMGGWGEVGLKVAFGGRVIHRFFC